MPHEGVDLMDKIDLKKEQHDFREDKNKVRSNKIQIVKIYANAKIFQFFWPLSNRKNKEKYLDLSCFKGFCLKPREVVMHYVNI